MKHFISLGAGVQSSTMSLMCAKGEITPMPDAAIFADTQWEPRKVYDWLDWLEKQLPFPVYRVTHGNLRATIGATRPHGKFNVIDIPAYVTKPDGTLAGLLNRSCTRDYKIVPIRKKVRELLGITGKRSPKQPIAEQWIGISRDEAHRMKPSREAWLLHRWPLIDKDMTRGDCLKWMQSNGYPPPPKSSCIGCPFHGDAQWKALTPEEFADAVEIDKRIRAQDPKVFRARGALYLHRSCVPLDQVDFRTKDEKAGQQTMFGDGFGNECEGMCGV